MFEIKTNELFRNALDLRSDTHLANDLAYHICAIQRLFKYNWLDHTYNCPIDCKHLPIRVWLALKYLNIDLSQS